MLLLNKKMLYMATTNTCREEKTWVNFFFISVQTQQMQHITRTGVFVQKGI